MFPKSGNDKITVLMDGVIIVGIKLVKFRPIETNRDLKNTMFELNLISRRKNILAFRL